MIPGTNPQQWLTLNEDDVANRGRSLIANLHSNRTLLQPILHAIDGHASTNPNKNNNNMTTLTTSMTSTRQR